MNGKVEIYSTIGCKYCRKAKAILDSYNIRYFNVDIVNPSASLFTEEMMNRISFAKRTTVPQIYVNEKQIGGCEDLEISIQNGEFLQLLEREGIPFDRFLKPTTIDNKKLEICDESTTIRLRPNTRYLNEISKLSSADDDSRPISIDFESPGQLAGIIQEQALLLTDQFATEDGMRVDYKKMRSSKGLNDFIAVCCLLKDISLESVSALPENTRLAMFVNLYNTLVMSFMLFALKIDL
jgi:glutaredoxin 3